MSVESQADHPPGGVDTNCIRGGPQGGEGCAPWEDCGVFRLHASCGDIPDSINGAAVQESDLLNVSNRIPFNGSGVKLKCGNGTERDKDRLLEDGTTEGGNRTEDRPVLGECCRKDKMVNGGGSFVVKKEADEACLEVSGAGINSGDVTSEGERKGGKHEALKGGRVEGDEILEGEGGGCRGLESEMDEGDGTGGTAKDGRVKDDNVFGIGAVGVADKASISDHTGSDSRSLEDNDSAVSYDYQNCAHSLCCLTNLAKSIVYDPHLEYLVNCGRVV